MFDLFIANWEIALLFFGVALLYSSVGFGGGSSYLAILALYPSFEFKFVRAVALLCNITVVTNGTIQFYRRKLLDLKKTLPLVLTSVPMAYLGGKLPLSERSFFLLLGSTLFIASFFIWFRPTNTKKSFINQYNSLLINILLGSSIGFLSGMVGIGGGIFLSPLLYLLNWDKAKKISATASFFILVNSVSGLIGQFQQPNFSLDWPLALVLMISVAIGGFIGSYLGTVKLNQTLVRKATAILILYVSYNLLTKYL